MLTVKQPPTYGYKSVHDLPTPPSTSRPSPPLAYQDTAQKSLSTIPRSHSPSYPAMSAPHRGLPPPAAMTLPPQQQVAPGPPSHHSQPHPPPPPPPPPSITQVHAQAQHTWSTLPAPPQQWQGAEESMRNWLQARTEEEKTRQEEEKTRQETLRLEQRKIEMDMLRASLGGGIPPPMVPLVFAGMGSGGTLPQATLQSVLEWAQQFMQSSQAHQTQQSTIPAVHASDTQRDSAGPGHGQYPGPSALPPSAPSSTGYGPYPGSPTRPRGQTLPGATPRPIVGQPSLPGLGTAVPASGQGPTTSGTQHQSHTQTQPPSVQQESSPSIYFHHWQPPTSQAGGSTNRPGSPSGETPRKRKTLGLQSSAATPNEQRLRSPPPLHQPGYAESSPQRKVHKRQRSDVSWYQATGQRPPPGSDHHQGMSPTMSRDREHTESRKPSVTSLLSGDPEDVVAGSQQASQTKSHT